MYCKDIRNYSISKSLSSLFYLDIIGDNAVAFFIRFLIIIVDHRILNSLRCSPSTRFIYILPY